jgi:chemotaxis protein methyltransferase CheR
MGVWLDQALLAEVSRLVASRLGLDFPVGRYADLARGLEEARLDLGFRCASSFNRWLASGEPSRRELDVLVGYLTVAESYFFREPISFETLELDILPRLVAGRRDGSRVVRLWSAGCSTGEEAYSLAISCRRAIQDIHAWNVLVLATDINSASIAKAERGVYTEWSFRAAPAWVRERYFVPAEGMGHAIHDAIKSLVRFGYLNLAADLYPAMDNSTSEMDVIFCRNVLMYLTPAHQRRVVAGLHRCLVDGGYLIVNAAEASTRLFSMFEQEEAGGGILYRKIGVPGRQQPVRLPDMSGGASFDATASSERPDRAAAGSLLDATKTATGR